MYKIIYETQIDTPATIYSQNFKIEKGLTILDFAITPKSFAVYGVEITYTKIENNITLITSTLGGGGGLVGENVITSYIISPATRIYIYTEEEFNLEITTTKEIERIERKLIK